MSTVTDIDGAAKVNSRTHDGNGEKILSVNVTADEDMSDKQGLIVATVGQGGWTKVVGDTSHDAADTNDPIKIGGKARSSAPADVADGDRVNAYFDLKGRLQVGGTVTVSGTTATSLDGAVYPGDATFDKCFAIGARFDDTSPTTMTEDNAGVLRMTNYRALHTNVRSSGGVELGTSSNPFNVLLRASGGGELGIAGTPLAIQSYGGSVLHDVDGSSVKPILVGGYASAAAPADVSADLEAVRSWYLRNGAQCVQLTAAGALIAGDATNGLDVDVTRLPALAAGTNNIGDVDVLTVPSDPFGANADAASATGSISAKLRYIASTGIPITGTATVSGSVTADTELPAAAALADGASNPTTPTAGSAQLLYNGSTWDRERGTIEGVALASAARTTTTYSDSITNYNCSGVIITWDMTVNGGHNVKMRVQYQDPASSKWQYLHADFGNYSTTGTRTYVIAPSATTSADIVQATAQYLPRTWRIEMTHATANSITYSVGYCMLR